MKYPKIASLIEALISKAKDTPKLDLSIVRIIVRDTKTNYNARYIDALIYYLEDFEESTICLLEVLKMINWITDDGIHGLVNFIYSNLKKETRLRFLEEYSDTLTIKKEETDKLLFDRAPLKNFSKTKRGSDYL